MKKIILLLSFFMIAGCVDNGRVGLHPQMKSAYVNARPDQVQSCLYSAAISQRLSLDQDDPLSGGT